MYWSFQWFFPTGFPTNNWHRSTSLIFQHFNCKPRHTENHPCRQR
jgi:hypothetical protein